MFTSLINTITTRILSFLLPHLLTPSKATTVIWRTGPIATTAAQHYSSRLEGGSEKHEYRCDETYMHPMMCKVTTTNKTAHGSIVCDVTSTRTRAETLIATPVRGRVAVEWLQGSFVVVVGSFDVCREIAV
jgi:hypothetical protein